MSIEDFKACIKGFGLTPMKPPYNGATIHQDGSGEVYRIPNPEELAEIERDAFIVLLKSRMGLGSN